MKFCTTPFQVHWKLCSSHMVALDACQVGHQRQQTSMSLACSLTFIRKLQWIFSEKIQSILQTSYHMAPKVHRFMVLWLCFLFLFFFVLFGAWCECSECVKILLLYSNENEFQLYPLTIPFSRMAKRSHFTKSRLSDVSKMLSIDISVKTVSSQNNTGYVRQQTQCGEHSGGFWRFS